MKNYTIQMNVPHIIREIRALLKDMGANRVFIEHDNLQPVAVKFQITARDEQVLNICIPVKIDMVLTELNYLKQRKRYVKADIEQACQVAWRAVKEWLEAQQTMIELGYMAVDDLFVNSPFVVVETCENGNMVKSDEAIRNDIYYMSRTELALEVNRVGTILTGVQTELRTAKTFLLHYFLKYNRIFPEFLKRARKWVDDMMLVSDTHREPVNIPGKNIYEKIQTMVNRLAVDTTTFDVLQQATKNVLPKNQQGKPINFQQVTLKQIHTIRDTLLKMCWDSGKIEFRRVRQIRYEITGTSHPAWLAWRGIQAVKKKIFIWCRYG